MTYFTCDTDGELNTVEFRDGMVIMYDTEYRKSLNSVYSTESSKYTDESGIYQGYLPRGWKFLRDVNGAVRGVNPDGRSNVNRPITVVNVVERGQTNLDTLAHRHPLPVSGSNSTTDLYMSTTAGAKRLNFSIRAGYSNYTENTTFDNNVPSDLNVPPQTRIAFLVRSVGD